VENSILKSVKKMCSVADDDPSFDLDLLLHINTVFADLNQLGVGPDDGYAIEDAVPTWDQYLGTDKNSNNIKQYMYLRVRMVFDIPATSFTQIAMKEQIAELTWRINVHREEKKWTDPRTGLPLHEDPTLVEEIVDREIEEATDDYPDLGLLYQNRKV
jgi:hypothetical protein